MTPSLPPFRVGAAAAAALSLLALTSCGTESSDDAGAAASGSTRTLTVFAAASLAQPFTTIGEQFEATHPGTRVSFSFGGSSGLVTQLEQGAPADVFASADEANMTEAAGAGLIAGSATPFARNTLTIVTAPGNPHHVTSLASLVAPGLSVVTCASAVPCGAAAQKVEQAAGVTLHPVSEEQSVTDVLGKVTSGQADAGLVYVTDAKKAGAKVASVPFPEAAKAVNVYPIAPLSQATNAALAAEFVTAVTGPRGRQVLDAAGFAAP